MNRKKVLSGFVAMSMLFSIAACGQQQSEQSEQSEQPQQQEQKTEQTNQSNQTARGVIKTKEELTFPLGNEINSLSFTGTAYIAQMIPNDEVYHFPQTNHITFALGARSGWHSHGGSANTSFAHIAVNTNPERTELEWFDRISDEEYQKLPTE